MRCRRVPAAAKIPSARSRWFRARRATAKKTKTTTIRQNERLTLVQIVRIPADGVDAFRRYEALVLPLLPRHGGLLERRLRTPDGLVEVHVLSFPSRDALDAYMRDPERQQHVAMKDASGATSELLEVIDVPAEG